MTPRFKIVLWAIILASVRAYSQQPDASTATTAGVVADGAKDGTAGVDRVGGAGDVGGVGNNLMGLLEFLGEFETEDGQWVDPEQLLQQTPSRRRARTRTSDKDDD